MGTLAEPHEAREIRTHLGGLMLDLLQAQFFACFVWQSDQQRFDSSVQLHKNSASRAIEALPGPVPAPGL